MGKESPKNRPGNGEETDIEDEKLESVNQLYKIVFIKLFGQKNDGARDPDENDGHAQMFTRPYVEITKHSNKSEVVMDTRIVCDILTKMG